VLLTVNKMNTINRFCNDTYFTLDDFKTCCQQLTAEQRKQHAYLLAYIAEFYVFSPTHKTISEILSCGYYGGQYDPYIRQALQDLSHHQHTVTNKYGQRMNKEACEFLVELGAVSVEDAKWWCTLLDSMESTIRSWSKGEDESADCYAKDKERINDILATNFPIGMRTSIHAVMNYV
jgi:hypothetical protein